MNKEDLMKTMLKGTIEKLSQENAVIIANSWKYSDQYSFYDMTADIDDYNEFVNEHIRGNNYFQYMSEDELLGFFCLEIIDNAIILGLGLRPDLTGQGYGKDFMKIIEQYIISHFTTIDEIKLSVATFNHRAIKLYEKCGYIKTEQSLVETNGAIYPFIHLSKYI
jgi:Acetyltransferases, including N-acetylases of ribosomal proteins